MESRKHLLAFLVEDDPFYMKVLEGYFATKSDYLLRSIETIPQDSMINKLGVNKKNGLTGLRRTDQIRKLRDYIFMVKVY